MVQYTVHYGFSQRFGFPARVAYEWSTDFQENDLARMGEKGKRKVERMDDATLVLTDIVDSGGKRETKVRLVRLYPDSIFWTNTRLSRVGRHSQFLYQIVEEGPKSSRLDFKGALVEEAPKAPTPAELKALSKRYAKEDAQAWVHLAAAMKKDLTPRRSLG